MNLRAILVGLPMPDRSRVTSHTKRDTGLGVECEADSSTLKNNLFQNLTISLGRMINKC